MVFMRRSNTMDSDWISSWDVNTPYEGISSPNTRWVVVIVRLALQWSDDSSAVDTSLIRGTKNAR